MAARRAATSLEREIYHSAMSDSRLMSKDLQEVIKQRVWKPHQRPEYHSEALFSAQDRGYTIHLMEVDFSQQQRSVQPHLTVSL
jgi:hypothetical protein